MEEFGHQNSIEGKIIPRRRQSREGERNIALLLSYDGGTFHGWQAQKGLQTVQGVLTHELSKTVGHPVTLHGCGRTDAGVHANWYVANFSTLSRIPADRLPYALNFRLPESIAVSRAAEVSWGFHAIHSLLKKEYTYKIYSLPHRDPFRNRYALAYPFKIPLDRWREAAAAMVGSHDFSALRSAGSSVKNTVRTVYECEVTEGQSGVSVRISANGFLYNMARAMVGTIMYYGEGKIDDIPALLASRDRKLAGPTVPPHGLYMTRTVHNEPLPWQE